MKTNFGIISILLLHYEQSEQDVYSGPGNTAI